MIGDPTEFGNIKSSYTFQISHRSLIYRIIFQQSQSFPSDLYSLCKVIFIIKIVVNKQPMFLFSSAHPLMVNLNLYPMFLFSWAQPLLVNLNLNHMFLFSCAQPLLVNLKLNTTFLFSCAQPLMVNLNLNPLFLFSFPNNCWLI